MSWGVEFDPVDVQADPAAREELRRAGVPLVPALLVGARAAHGWNPEAYAALLGVDYRGAAKLPPDALGARLDSVLAAAEALMRCVPFARLGWRPPERDRRLGDLGFHVFRLSLAFVEAMLSGELREAPLQETTPADLATGVAIAEYGARVRAHVRAWLADAGPEEFARVIRVYYGPQSGHELLERTTWHAAQHLRQLYALAERLALTPPEPLPVDALQGLPLPESLW